MPPNSMNDSHPPAESPGVTLRTRLVRHMADIDRDAWNALGAAAYPFLRHEFLLALERQGCLDPRVGWVPHHLVFEDEQGRLRAACPTYLKYNSFGEFVFDWSWADAYRQAGLDYYPKLVVAAPFTPATGPRLLLAPDLRGPACTGPLIETMIGIAGESRVSSLHWLFANDEALLGSPLLLHRMGCQFHWENRGYAGFDEFLAQLTAKRRKEILRERRQVRDAGVELRRLPGNQVEPELWDLVYELYCTTFAKHGNYPALSAGFFRAIAAGMGEQVLLVLALRDGRIIGAAYFLVGRDTLYGRYWGCSEEIPALHFEACYYQGLEYCMEAGLRRFEPGAQGEHKISRGFLPTPTWSAHWIAHPDFRRAIGQFLQRERRGVQEYMARLDARSPYKRESC